MSRVGRAPIPVPAGVEVTVRGREVRVTGPQGELSRTLPGDITLRQEDSTLLVERPDDQRHSRALHGLTRSLVNNMVAGVTTGFAKDLEIVGVGYRAAVQGKNLQIQLGYSHDIVYPIPEGITIATPRPTEIVVSGIDGQKVGHVAAEIRSFRKPEPYKGKGVRYRGERVVRKAGKAAK